MAAKTTSSCVVVQQRGNNSAAGQPHSIATVLSRRIAIACRRDSSVMSSSQ